MSVSVKTYVIYGARVSVDLDLFEKVYSDIDELLNPDENGMFCLYDGMCGNYTIFGKLIASINQDEELLAEFDSFTSKNDHLDTQKWIKETLAKVGVHWDGTPKLILVNHFS